MAMTKKEALLKAAKELFGECGYTETTFKKISERAGVALGLLTHHYGNKEKLFLAAGMDVLERFHEVLQRACDELLVKETAQILMSLVVGANRTRVLTPYAPPHLYREAVAFAARAITPCNACE